MMAVNIQSVQTLCHGCLSADRDLSPIGEFTDMFTMICDRKARLPGLKCTSLCWECTATLKRMQSFHKQVNDAQTILKFYVRNKDKHLPKSLSRLKTTITKHNFISFIEPDEPQRNIMPLHEIKEEVDQDESEVYKLELKHDEDENNVMMDIFDADDDFTYSDDIKSGKPTLIKDDENVVNNNIFDANDDFTYSDDIKSGKPTLIKEDENVVNNNIFDADDDFTYSDDIKSGKPTLIKKQKSVETANKQKPTHIKKQKSVGTANKQKTTHIKKQKSVKTANKEKQTHIKKRKRVKTVNKKKIKSATIDKPEEKKSKGCSRYGIISTPEEMCVKEQARPSDLVNLWGQDGCFVQGSHASGTQNSKHDEHNPHACNACHTRYPTLEELNSHVTSHSIYRCLVCGHRSPSMEAAGQHVIEHGEIIKCSSCEYCCRKKRDVIVHYMIAHREFWCEHCNMKKRSKSLLERHITRQHMENICKYCSRTYRDYSRLHLHIIYMHSKTGKKQLRDKTKLEMQYCNIKTAEEMCVKEQARPSELSSHELSSHELSSHVTSHEVYRCLVCGHRSPSMEAAGHHVTQHGKVLKCSFCEYCCSNYRNIREHYKLAHTQFCCDYCGKKYRTKMNVEQHILKHHIRSFKCKECERTYSKQCSLKWHIAYVHEVCETADTFCVECNIQFKNRERFKVHLKNTFAHAPHKYKWFKCQDADCDKTYRNRSKMMSHYKYTHLGQQIHCSICDKSFGTAATYNIHFRHKHEGIPKPRDKICSVCGRGFTEKHFLDNHMRTHTGERPFACAVCDARFALKYALKRHQKRRHGGQNKADS